MIMSSEEGDKVAENEDKENLNGNEDSKYGTTRSNLKLQEEFNSDEKCDRNLSKDGCHQLIPFQNRSSDDLLIKSVNNVDIKVDYISGGVSNSEDNPFLMESCNLNQPSFDIKHNDNFQNQMTKKPFSYGSPHDTLEDAFRFIPPPNLAPKKDPFVKKMLLVLAKFSSINVTSKKEINKTSRGFKSEMVLEETQKHRGSSRLPLSKDGSKPKQYKLPVAAPEEKAVSEHSSYTSLCNTKKIKPESNYLNKLQVEPDVTREITEKNKVKYIALIKTLCGCDDSLFNSVFLKNKKDFLELLPQIESVQEITPQIVEVLSKVCSPTYSLNNVDILSNIVHGEFVNKLITYITMLPADYNEDNFSESQAAKLFQNLIEFCETVNTVMPFNSKGVIRKLLMSMEYSLTGFMEYQEIKIDSVYSEKIKELLQICSEPLRENKKQKAKTIERKENEDLMNPPDSIRASSILPTKRDLFEMPTFLRKNVVDGSYRNVEHYIDVQFRLLREDFIAPLRNSIQEYCKSVGEGSYNNNQRFDNIRIHEDVKIMHGSLTNGRFGHLVQLSKEVKNHSKRFMFGSLLLFTADQFNTFICATVVNPVGDRYLVVEVKTQTSIDKMYSSIYTMVESEIYFEPYFQVLNALQQIDVDSFPMKEYIVDVKLQNEDNETLKVQSCPIGLNHSQQRAFKSAIANEFVAIQGPPGTGKTFLATRIAKALLLEYGPINDMTWTSMGETGEYLTWKERKRGNRRYCVFKEMLLTDHDHEFFDEDERNHSPILVICFTNHALDQFLAKLLRLTKRVVRVGGQSKLIELQKFNLKEIRKSLISREKNAHYLCYCSRCEQEIEFLKRHFVYLSSVKEITFLYLTKLKILESVATSGLLKMQTLRRWMSPRQATQLDHGQYESWLLQGAHTFTLPKGDVDKIHKSDTNFHTSHIVSELRQSATYIDDLEIFNTKSIEEKADDHANKKLFWSVKELQKNISNLQKRLRKLEKNGGDENVLNVYQSQINNLQKQRHYVSHMLTLQSPMDSKKIKELIRTPNVWSLDHNERWMLYQWWAHQYLRAVKHEMIDLEETLKIGEQDFIQTRSALDIKILMSANVVGTTTTSAARLRETIEIVGPEIVIVEEAAEVLEAHIVAALPSTVKKVLLIGDHKQLRPSTAVYRLAQQYKLDVSLFERMVNNGLGCEVLSTQHRMRPEIASLIVPAIYPDLLNAETVKNRPDIRGVASNVFFLTHTQPEDEVSDSSSRRNSHEVDFTIRLCQYLFDQGYDSSEITILATYAGQVTEMEKERRRRSLPTDLRITTVDNYQGEENEIILLSLVRSNAEARIGFLSAENRVCVALSRARDGLYMIGNMDNLTRSSDIWPQIKAQLEKTNSIGPVLPLGCKNHPKYRSNVARGSDFMGVPSGGCHVKCGAKLPCGHTCKEFCHSIDPHHTYNYSCPLPCERMACSEHRCLKRCGEDCGSCAVEVVKALPCGHSANLKCDTDPELHLCKHLKRIKQTCGHETTQYCYQKVNPRCQVLCTGKRRCGHPCESLCHRGLHLGTSTCCFEVEKVLGCGHICKVPCYESSKVSCEEPCTKTFSCGHACTKHCGETCGQCETLVEKTLSPCGHQVMLQCSLPPESSQCSAACERTLPCGHGCPSICSTDCSSTVCQETVMCQVEPGCEHGLIDIPCYLNTPGLQSSSDQLLQWCLAPCRADLPCGHVCVGCCGDCMQGRLHVPCVHKCKKTLLCGHRCEEPCKNECPVLCYQPCLYRCQHKACSAACGEPCSPCKKRCVRRCKHRQCSRLCCEDCDIPPCPEPCNQTLPCGHRCAGLCGELCPQQCVVCSPEAFHTPGYLTDPHHRYVLLEDCGHPVEDKLLNELMSNGHAKGQLGECPVCNEPIKRNGRYKDLIRNFYKDKATRKEKMKEAVNGFLENMKTKTYNYKFVDSNSLEKYGESAFTIVEHLQKGPHTYKTSLWLDTYYKKLIELVDEFKIHNDNEKACDLIVGRCGLILRALCLRMESMSTSDSYELLTEIYRLELATMNWPAHRGLMESLQKYSLEQLKAL